MFSFWWRGCNLLSIFWFWDLTSLIYVNSFSLLYTEEDDMFVTPWGSSWLMVWAVLCLTSPPCSNPSFPPICPQVSSCISNAYSIFLNYIMWCRSISENTSPQILPCDCVRCYYQFNFLTFPPKFLSSPQISLLLFCTIHLPHCRHGLPEEFMPFIYLKAPSCPFCSWVKFKSLSLSHQVLHNWAPNNLLGFSRSVPPDTPGFCCTEFFSLPGICHALHCALP